MFTDEFVLDNHTDLLDMVGVQSLPIVIQIQNKAKFQ